MSRLVVVVEDDENNIKEAPFRINDLHFLPVAATGAVYDRSCFMAGAHVYRRVYILLYIDAYMCIICIGGVLRTTRQGISHEQFQCNADNSQSPAGAPTPLFVDQFIA